MSSAQALTFMFQIWDRNHRRRYPNAVWRGSMHAMHQPRHQEDHEGDEKKDSPSQEVILDDAIPEYVRKEHDCRMTSDASFCKFISVQLAWTKLMMVESGCCDHFRRHVTQAAHVLHMFFFCFRCLGLHRACWAEVIWARSLSEEVYSQKRLHQTAEMATG